MAVGTQATSLNGWFGGRCGLLMVLCNKSSSKAFFLDDFCRSLLPLSVPPMPLEKVDQSSPLACFLIAPLYTQSGMVSIQTALTGVQHLTPSSLLSGVWNVPYRRNPYFTGRDELLDRLNQQLSSEVQEHGTAMRRAALTQPQAIKGLGGIGKTQIAVEYAYRSREHDLYTHTLWVNAASKEALFTSFVALAELLPAFPAKEETDQRKLVEAIKRWLEQCQHRWLLVFDNADDIALVGTYLPKLGNGSILLTTRANAVGSLATSVEVETMGFVEGTHLLLRRAQRFEQASDEEINQAGNIVVALDHFPLALDQAGAYIEETQCGFTEYLEVYRNHRDALLARRGNQAVN